MNEKGDAPRMAGASGVRPGQRLWKARPARQAVSSSKAPSLSEPRQPVGHHDNHQHLPHRICFGPNVPVSASQVQYRSGPVVSRFDLSSGYETSSPGREPRLLDQTRSIAIVAVALDPSDSLSIVVVWSAAWIMGTMELGRLLGKGKEAEVFACGDHVLKLYNAAARKSSAFREAANLAVVETLGVAAPVALGVRQIGDRWAVAMTLAAGASFGEAMLHHRARVPDSPIDGAAAVGHSCPPGRAAGKHEGAASHQHRAVDDAWCGAAARAARRPCRACGR